MFGPNKKIIIGAFWLLAFGLLSANDGIAGQTCVDSGDGKRCTASYCYTTNGTNCVSQLAYYQTDPISAYGSAIFSISTTNPQRRITKILLQPNISGWSTNTQLSINKKVSGTVVASKTLKSNGSGSVSLEYDLTSDFGQVDINGTYTINVSDNWCNTQYTSCLGNNLLWLSSFNLIINYECPGDVGCDNVPDRPKLVASPASSNYGSVSIGQKSGVVTYTISNSGQANFTVMDVTKSGVNSGEFHKVADNCTGKTLDYHPGANNSCTFQYQFSPETPGAKSANLLIVTDIFKNSQSLIAVSGTATGGQKIQVAPTTDSFQQVPAGLTSSPHFYTVTNTGSAQLTLGTLSIAGTNAADFKVANDQCSGKVLASKAFCTFQAVFSPTSQGTKSSSVRIPSNDPSAALVSIPLTGTAAAISQSYCN